MKSYNLTIDELMLTNIQTLVQAGIINSQTIVEMPDKTKVSLAEIAIDVKRFLQKEIPSQPVKFSDQVKALKTKNRNNGKKL